MGKPSMSNGSGGKSRMGRQKIEIKRIVSEEARQVCFSKRRNGLIKKAGELCILCGAEIAIIVFSPAGKAFSYGEPSIDAVLHRFLHPSSPASSSSLTAAPDPRRAMVVEDLNHQHDELVRQIDAEKRRREVLLLEHQRHGRGGLWDADFSEMTVEHITEFAGVLEEMRSALAKHAEELTVGMSFNNIPQNTAMHHHHYRQLASSLPATSAINFLPPSFNNSINGNPFTNIPNMTTSNHDFMGSSVQHHGAIVHGSEYNYLNNHVGSFNPLDFTKYDLNEHRL